mgnify:CR=1 FL=1
MKRRTFLVCTAALFCGALLAGGCTQKTSQPVLQQIEYSNLADSDTQALLSKLLQDADVWGKTLNETSTPFNNMMELYFEDFDIDGLLAKYESGKYSVRYATELTELAGGQKLVRLYDPSGNLIEVRTPFRGN